MARKEIRLLDFEYLQFPWYQLTESYSPWGFCVFVGFCRGCGFPPLILSSKNGCALLLGYLCAPVAQQRAFHERQFFMKDNFLVPLLHQGQTINSSVLGGKKEKSIHEQVCVAQHWPCHESQSWLQTAIQHSSTVRAAPQWWPERPFLRSNAFSS